MSSFTLSIGDLVARTGVTEPTLRMWERRHGFPQPRRMPSGHRRYSEEQVLQVRKVLAARGAGLSLPAAIVRAQHQSDRHRLSLYATLRRLAPELESRLLRKRALLALSHAIEDESLARAEPRLLFACFQRERFYRQSQARWRELSVGAEAAAVFADFGTARLAAEGPAEIPIARTDPLAREWALVFHGEHSSICMAARESASSQADAPSVQRSFEVVWTVDPEQVRAAARTCIELAASNAPELAQRAGEWLAQAPLASMRDQLQLATAVINRTLSLLG